MKKIFSILLCSIMLFSSFMIGSLTFAQQNANTDSKNLELPSNGLDGNCLTGIGSKCFRYDKMILGREDQRTVFSILQDVILTAGLAVGTVLTIVCLYCGIMYISAANGGDSSKAKNMQKGLINAGIGAMLVWCAYGIVRFVQYIAQG